MATTINESFRKLRSNLQITGLQESTVSTRQQNVRKVMEAGMTVHDSFLTGSYSRSTMIAPLSQADVDIFFVLDASYYSKYSGPAALLDATKRTLLKTYTRTPDISRNGQAVTIRFDDFVVDVAPGFYRTGGGFLIPNSITSGWISTDPKKHVEIFRSANQTHNGDLVPLITMIKGWNKSHSAFFRSFHLEVVALEALTNVRITDFPSGIRFFFDKGRTLIAQKNVDPAGYGDDVGGYLNTPEKVQEAKQRFQVAYERALKAEDFAARGYTNHAIDMWQKIFGEYFPAYG